MTKGNIILHCGAKHVSYDDLVAVPVPAETKTFHPIPHHSLVDMVHEVMDEHGPKHLIADKDWQYGLTHDGNRMFAVMRWRDPDVSDIGFAIGVRNSHDKSFSCAMALGGQVFVCDNMAFAGNILMLTRHEHEPLTAVRRSLIGALIGEGTKAFDKITMARATLSDIQCPTQRAYRVIGQALGEQILSATIAAECYRQWNEPEYPDFRAPNLWSLYNAGTYALKKAPIKDQMQRLSDWHKLMTTDAIEIATY